MADFRPNSVKFAGKFTFQKQARVPGFDSRDMMHEKNGKPGFEPGTSCFIGIKCLFFGQKMAEFWPNSVEIAEKANF